MLGMKGADDVHGDGTKVLDYADHIVVVGMARREELLVKYGIDAVIRHIFELLAPFVDDDFALVVEVLLCEVLRKEGEGVGLHPQIALEAAGRYRGAEFGEVFIEVAASVGRAETFELRGDRVSPSTIGCPERKGKQSSETHRPPGRKDKGATILSRAIVQPLL